MDKDTISKKLNAETGIEQNKKMSVDQKTADMKKVVSEKDTAKENLQKIIAEGMSLLPNAIMLTREMENPKMYDSMANFMKTLAELNKSLVSIEETKKPEQKSNVSLEDNQEQSKIEQTNIFIGSTEDILGKLDNRKTLDGDFKVVKKNKDK